MFSIRDPEPGLSDGRLVDHVDSRDPCGGRALARPLDELLDGIDRSLGGELDRAVRTVAYPPAHTEALGGPLTVGTKGHTLHPTVDDDPSADDTILWSWHVEQSDREPAVGATPARARATVFVMNRVPWSFEHPMRSPSIAS